MTNRFANLATAAALSLAALAGPALAEETSAVYGKGTGALAFETLGLATSAADVRRQGGFATAAAIDWKSAPREQAETDAVYGAGSVGALTLATQGLATSASDVRRQGGAMTAGAVRWVSLPASR